MSVQIRDGRDLKESPSLRWSSALPLLLILALIFLSPLIFDLSRSLGSLLGAK